MRRTTDSQHTAGSPAVLSIACASRQLSRLSRVASMISLGVAACATSRHAGRSTPTTDDTLTSEELASTPGTTRNAYSAVERLRPLFLTVRPGSGTVHGTSQHLYVFINGSFAGEIDVLKTIPVATVESIRRVQASEAFIQLGELRAGDGVLLVRLHR